MIRKAVAAGLLITAAVFASSAAPQRPATMIELVARDGSSTIGSIYINDQGLMLEPGDKSVAFVLTADELIVINHKEKTYGIQTYEEIQAGIMHKASEIAGLSDSAGGPDVEIKVTNDSATISGTTTHKVVLLSHGKADAEFWVSEDLLPAGIRAKCEKLKAVLPDNYWKKVRGSPGMVEIITLYGVPLKMSGAGHTMYEARVSPAPSGVSFQVPADYKRVQN